MPAAVPASPDALRFLYARDQLLRLRDDRAAAVGAFRWPQLDTFNWALDHFYALAQRSGEATALWIVEADGSEQRLSFAQLAQRSAQVANFLRAQGVRRGDRVLMVLGNEVALWETMLAAIKLGAVLIPATALLTPDDLRDRIARGEVRHVVVGAGQVPKFAALDGAFSRVCVGEPQPGWVNFDDSRAHPVDFDPQGPTHATDPMLLYFTSGTTAQPKLVLHTHQSYPVGHLSTMYWLGLRPGDVHLNISSPGWAKHAWSCFFAPWNAGACVFIHNTPRFSPQGLLATLERCRVTSLCAPPTVWRMLIQEDLAAWQGRLALREVIGAGEPLNPEIIEQVRKAWGLTLRDGYGQTETTALAGNSPGQKVKIGSMGRPLPGYRVQITDIDGQVTKEGEVTLVLGANRPAGLMQGYQGDDGKLSGADGDLYRSGDVVFADDEGYLTFVGRSDDVFKSSDYRISPFELESILLEHESVAEAAVVPSPDPIRLAIPKAYVLLVSGTARSAETALSIFLHLHRRLAPFKRIRRIELVTELPKTISGKIRRVQLRRLEHDNDRGDPLRGDE
ncbi:MAG: AMP-binding protein, partial [Hydrogenophaga sp.]|nr:AMP-binding protein [Hydrogenophaga sp.]